MINYIEDFFMSRKKIELLRAQLDHYNNYRSGSGHNLRLNRIKNAILRIKKFKWTIQKFFLIVIKNIFSSTKSSCYHHRYPFPKIKIRLARITFGFRINNVESSKLNSQNFFLLWHYKKATRMHFFVLLTTLHVVFN